uniref:putative sarcosine dimethylglycine methyltransferase n=1 Tax=Galdieria sulphuraria TaxID=130081 RepID=UPI0000EB660C
SRVENSNGQSQPAATSKTVKDNAEIYYDDDDSDRFYFHVWGGEDIHVGLYKEPVDQDEIREASLRTDEWLASELAMTGVLQRQAKGLDLGAGYGGAARFLVRKFGVSIDCLNIAPVQNKRNEEYNNQAGLADNITVKYGSFLEIPCEDNSYDFIWSQDAFLHSPDKLKVFQECARVLKPRGVMAITDPMKEDGIDKSSIQPILDRIKLHDMGSLGLYRSLAKECGLVTLRTFSRPDSLVHHYSKVKAELIKRSSEIASFCSPEFQANMKRGLEHWIEGGRAGKLTWGGMLFRKSDKI